MAGNDEKISSSDNKHIKNRETCKAVMVFTPLLVLIICCCIVTLLGFRKFEYISSYASLIFNKTTTIENVCEENEYRSADAPIMKGQVDTSTDYSSSADAPVTETHEIIFPYYGDCYAHMTIDNKDVGIEDYPVYWGDSDTLLDQGLVQSNYSAYIGVPGRVVIAGHNHTYFRTLPKVKIGDVVTLTTDYGVFTYKVSDTQILGDTDTSLLYYDPLAEKVTDDLIMYTCWNNGYMGLSDERLYIICEVVSKQYNN